MPTIAKQSQPEPSTHLLRIMLANRQGWDRFLALYAPVIMAWLVRSGVPHQDAQDILQDVFLAVSRNLDKFNIGQPFHPWLWTIVHNRRIDAFRRQQHKPQGQGGTDFFNVVQAVPDSACEVDPDFRHELVRQAMDIVQKEVAPAVWDAFRLVVLEQVAYEEAATRLGVTKRAVYQKVFKVKERLRELVGEDS